MDQDRFMTRVKFCAEWLGGKVWDLGIQNLQHSVSRPQTALSIFIECSASSCLVYN